MCWSLPSPHVLVRHGSVRSGVHCTAALPSLWCVVMDVVVSVFVFGSSVFLCELHFLHAMDVGLSGTCAKAMTGLSGYCVSTSGGSVHASATAHVVDILRGRATGSPSFVH